MAALFDSVLRPAQEITAVDFTNSASAESEALPESSQPTIQVQVMATANCHIALPRKDYTTEQKATNTKSMPIPAWTPMVFKMTPKHKISVIGNTGSGKLFITVME